MAGRSSSTNPWSQTYVSPNLDPDAELPPAPVDVDKVSEGLARQNPHAHPTKRLPEPDQRSWCMGAMIARAACLVVAGVVVIACGSPSGGASHALTSPSHSVGTYLGSLGTAGCKPAAAVHGWQIQGGFPEVGIDTSRGSFWALFFTPVPPPRGKDIKVVWRMTGTGEFTFEASDADGTTAVLVWGPTAHSSSNWTHTGDEVGTGFNFTS